ncbi:ABC transporter permease [Flavitalea sp. BT771]|uniref:ABC transporter permease n=1 Tax=Flavitalea sp. BT771 TaxID=3063329 RepID=UPI0026E202DE|nr:ABC transporter permease [Flavitalea sp. BT771]MDO6434425.1 ABC transporter permease [Flavitalea sp. BT771]MDV6223325.1 ABC transporter permease [Flavitalea sp. BT771]
MIKNYFRIAWRNISRHKVYTAINVTGLALGICACMVIYLVTAYEFSFDRDHPDGDRIYRIAGEAKMPDGNTFFLNSVLGDMGMGGLETQIPGFEAKAAFYDYPAGVSIPDGKNPPKRFDNRIAGSYAATTIITNPSYFEVFHYQWLAGDAAVLNHPFTVVLSKKRAEKYFGDLSPEKIVGKTVIYDDSLQVTVAGVVNDWAGNTDFGYTDFISIGTATHSFLRARIPTEDWSSLRIHSSMAFVRLAKGTKAATVNARMNAYVKDHFPGQGPKISLWLQPLSDIHFSRAFHRGDDGDDFRKPYLPTLYMLMGVALFILVIAVVNFINLSTAQSIQRAKEVGVRKVLGSRRKNIIFQFLAETLVLTIFAVLLSVMLVKPVLHAFKDFVPEGVSFHPFQTNTLLFLLIITGATALMAGFYPARVLSSYLPLLSLKGAGMHKGTERVGLRKALIVFQFTISLIFIIAALTIGKQMNFMKNADKGFNTDAIITINKWGDKQGRLKMFAANIQKLKGIDKIVSQGNAPMGFAKMTMGLTYKDIREVKFEAVGESGNEGYIPFYKMRLIAGRNLLHSDSLKEFVVNETLTKTLGFKHPAEALGKRLNVGDRSYPIVGVIADFYQGSFHDAIQAAVVGNMPEEQHSLAIKLTTAERNSKDVKALLAGMEKEWKKVFPSDDFRYSFLNESIAFLYGQEENTAWLINVAMSITIFISCMGLFGLGMFTAQRRTKEIGIRKVLGASVSDIAVLLNRDFVVLVIIAFIIAAPVSWYFMHQWLQDFAYRTPLSWWVFGVAGIATVLIALLTVSFQAFKAAVANPVDSLRTE